MTFTGAPRFIEERRYYRTPAWLVTHAPIGDSRFGKCSLENASVELAVEAGRRYRTGIDQHSHTMPHESAMQEPSD